MSARLPLVVAVLLLLGSPLLVLGITLERGGEAAGYSSSGEAAEHSAEAGHAEQTGHDERIEERSSPGTEAGAEGPLAGLLESPVALGGLVVLSLMLAAAVWRRPVRPVLAVVALFAAVALVFDLVEVSHQIAGDRTGLAVLTGLVAATRLAVLAGVAGIWRTG